jgi:hypothetical protein
MPTTDADTNTDGWLRRSRSRARTGSGTGHRDRRRRRWTPEMTQLERRDLSAVSVPSDTVFVHPGILPPTNGQFVPVLVYGRIFDSRPQTPSGFFHVTDEYRRVEPFGKFSLVPAGKAGASYAFRFEFTINLQAKRSTKTPDGRHYDILVGATDVDGNGGRTIEVLVPKKFPPPPLGKPTVAGPRARH